MKLILQNGCPIAEANDDYTGPMEWIAAPEGYVLGSFVLPGQPLPVPASCQRRQGRLALLTLGLLDAAEAVIEGIEDITERRAAQIEYEADTWERSNAFLQQLWAQLGGSPESLDDAFRLAVTL